MGNLRIGVEKLITEILPATDIALDKGAGDDSITRGWVQAV
jgi:hypothetical protein